MRAAHDADETSSEPAHALAPSRPSTALGEMASYYLSAEPHLFQDAVDRELVQLQRAQREDAARERAPPAAGSDLVLSRRVRQLRRAERRRAVEDLMYVCVLARFKDLGVALLRHVEEPVAEEAPTLRALTEGVHSREAVELVKEHVLSLLGPVATAPPAARVRMSRLQAAQVYAASILFGYALRRANVRFRLARQLGDLPPSAEETLERLERMVGAADEPPPAWAAPHPEVPGSERGPQREPFDPDQPLEQATHAALPVGPRRNALRHYIESFDQETMQRVAR